MRIVITRPGTLVISRHGGIWLAVLVAGTSVLWVCSSFATTWSYNEWSTDDQEVHP